MMSKAIEITTSLNRLCPAASKMNVSNDYQIVELEKRIMVNEEDFLNNLAHRVYGNFEESWRIMNWEENKMSQ